MIEKLPFAEIHTGGENMVDQVEFRPVAPYEMQHKINELVDAVNGILDYAPLEMAMKAEQKTELERTRKALEIAVDALKLFCGEDVSYYSQSKIDARDARTALEQITALEQKDK